MITFEIWKRLIGCYTFHKARHLYEISHSEPGRENVDLLFQLVNLPLEVRHLQEEVALGAGPVAQLLQRVPTHRNHRLKKTWTDFKSLGYFICKCIFHLTKSIQKQRRISPKRQVFFVVANMTKKFSTWFLSWKKSKSEKLS